MSRSPEINRQMSETATKLLRPRADYASVVTDIFRRAHAEYPQIPETPIEYQRLEADNPFSYRNYSDQSSIIPLIERVRRDRGKVEPDDGRPDDPMVMKYAKFRSLASGFWGSSARWQELNPEDKVDESLYFHDVHVGDLSGHMPPEAVFIGDLVVMSTFENEQNGKQLIEAALRVIQRIGSLATLQTVQDELAPLEVPAVARRKDTYKGVDKHTLLRNTGTRQLIEATMTASQSAALLLSGLDTDFDITDAFSSLDKNGTFKLLRLFPAGVIGPLAVNGVRWNPDHVLNQELLERDEFSASARLREKTIAAHVRDKESKLTSLYYSSEETTQSLITDRSIGNLGCPAKSDAIKFVVDLLAQELKPDAANTSFRGAFATISV